MTDLETILLHCEREPSVEALSYAADEFLSAGDEEMYRGLAYMAENNKMPWRSAHQYSWWKARLFIGRGLQHMDFFDDLPKDIMNSVPMSSVMCSTFANAVRWLGKRLREMDAEKVFRAEQSIPDDAGIMS